jgi:hypothetical protein
MVREFDNRCLADMYQPAGEVESWLRGKKVRFWVEGEPRSSVGDEPGGETSL